MKEILSGKKLDFNFFCLNLHTIEKGIIEIFRKIKEYGFTSFSSLSFQQSTVFIGIRHFSEFLNRIIWFEKKTNLLTTLTQKEYDKIYTSLPDSNHTGISSHMSWPAKNIFI